MGSVQLLAAALQPNNLSDSDIFACSIDGAMAYVAIFVAIIAALLAGEWFDLPAEAGNDPILLSHGRRCRA